MNHVMDRPTWKTQPILRPRPKPSLFNESDLYVERPADAELLHSLHAGAYACVLSARQTGKTSLLHRTLCKLTKQGYRCVKLDMGVLFFEKTVAQWYLSLACEIATWLGQAADFAVELFARHKRHTAVQRFTLFLLEALRWSEAPLIVFLDEAESLLTMPSSVTTEFLTALRFYFDDRDATPLYRRLSFCLLGTYPDAERIRSSRRTPLHIGHEIVLKNFDWESLRASLLPRFTEEMPQGEAVLARVHFWTQGHPWFTHQLCEELLARDHVKEDMTPRTVDSLVKEFFQGKRRLEYGVKSLTERAIMA